MSGLADTKCKDTGSRVVTPFAFHMQIRARNLLMYERWSIVIPCGDSDMSHPIKSFRKPSSLMQKVAAGLDLILSMEI